MSACFLVCSSTSAGVLSSGSCSRAVTGSTSVRLQCGFYRVVDPGKLNISRGNPKSVGLGFWSWCEDPRIIVRIHVRRCSLRFFPVHKPVVLRVFPHRWHTVFCSENKTPTILVTRHPTVLTDIPGALSLKAQRWWYSNEGKRIGTGKTKVVREQLSCYGFFHGNSHEPSGELYALKTFCATSIPFNLMYSAFGFQSCQYYAVP